MKHWILAAATILIIQGADAREYRGPPRACPQPEVDCCEEPKCETPCEETGRKSRGIRNPFSPGANGMTNSSCEPVCEKPCEPVCETPCEEMEQKSRGIRNPFAPSANRMTNTSCEPVCEKPCEPVCETPCEEAEQKSRGIRNPFSSGANGMTDTSCDPVCEKPCEPCPPPCPVVLNPAYNLPASIKTDCGWNVWIDASFTYWEAMQDDMEIAIQAPGTAAGVAANGFTGGTVVEMDDEYKPGFKVGLGFTSNYDNWDALAEYTWFRSTVNTSASAPANGVLVPIAGNTFVHNSGVYNNVSSSWDADLDILDTRLGRWYYVGKKLDFHPFMGIRASWIRQNWNTTFQNVNLASPANTVTSNQTVHSWGLGPEFGLNTHWNFCHGMRIFGDMEADVLFTQYTTAKATDLNPTGSRSFEVTESDNNALRAHIDLGLGFGWGRYFHCRRWYLDLSAAYNFQVFFNQNQFREYQLGGGTSSDSNGNLYLHGLTITAMGEF